MTDIESFVFDRIAEILIQRGWTLYKLSQKSTILYSSLNTMIKHRHTPKLSTLNKICEGFDISLSDFFYSFNNNNNNNNNDEFLNLWNILDEGSQKMVSIYMSGLANKQIH